MLAGTLTQVPGNRIPLKQLHDDLDAAVLEAYGWNDWDCSGGLPLAISASLRLRPSHFSLEEGSTGDAHMPPLQLPIADILTLGGGQDGAVEQELLKRLVALNHARAAEEKRGQTRMPSACAASSLNA